MNDVIVSEMPKSWLYYISISAIINTFVIIIFEHILVYILDYLGVIYIKEKIKLNNTDRNQQMNIKLDVVCF